MNLNYMYELPFGSGKRFLSSNSVVSKILGDWSLSGFTTWMSGDPLVLEPEFNNTGGVVQYLRVNSVPGVDPHPANPGPDAWFNPAAFAHPGAFEIGNVPRTHPTLTNPIYQNHDLAVTKRVPLSSEKSIELSLPELQLHQPRQLDRSRYRDRSRECAERERRQDYWLAWRSRASTGREVQLLTPPGVFRRLLALTLLFSLSVPCGRRPLRNARLRGAGAPPVAPQA